LDRYPETWDSVKSCENKLGRINDHPDIWQSHSYGILLPFWKAILEVLLETCGILLPFWKSILKVLIETCGILLPFWKFILKEQRIPPEHQSRFLIVNKHTYQNQLQQSAGKTVLLGWCGFGNRTLVGLSSK